MSESPVLCHGPTSQFRAAVAAQGWGRVAGVFGTLEQGLNVALVREASSCMRTPPIHEGRSSVVVGPLDRLTQAGIVDVFLKTLEEPHPRMPRAYLWALDLGDVSETITSRCLTEWCPGEERFDERVTAAARAVVLSYQKRSPLGFIEALAPLRATWQKDGPQFARALSASIKGMGGVSGVELWDHLRPVICDAAAGPDDYVVAVMR